MLQQTTVAAVIPYYERFLKAFPTVTTLATAPEEQVLRHWEGLGYYRRARHLHAAAKMIVDEFNGQFPHVESEAAKLPGVGRYILGAVLSQAFETRLPIVEANSLRVLARLKGLREDPRSGPGLRRVWEIAESLLPRKRVGDFNQALMELGALVCTPRQPKCGECPLQKECVANHDGLQELIPPPKVPTQVVNVREVALVIRRGGKVLLGRRPTDAKRWAGFWEFPHGEVLAKETMTNSAMRIAKDLTGLSVEVEDRITVIQHTITRFAITMTVFEAASRSRVVRSEFYSELRWCDFAEVASLPLSTSQRELSNLLNC